MRVKRRWAYWTSPASARAQKARTLLTGKVWLMRPAQFIRAWICFNWIMVAQDSMISRIGSVIMTLVLEFHLGLLVIADEIGRWSERRTWCLWWKLNFIIIPSVVPKMSKCIGWIHCQKKAMNIFHPDKIKNKNRNYYHIFLLKIKMKSHKNVPKIIPNLH